MPETELAVWRPDAGLFRQAMDGLADHAFVLLDDSYCVRFWSRGAEMMFGRSAVDTLGLDLDRVFGEENHCWDLPNEQSEESADMRLRKRCWFTRPDGSRRDLITTATALRASSACVGFALHAHVVAADAAPSDTSSDISHEVAERVPALSDELREMTGRLEAEKAERAEVERSRIRQLRGIVVSQEDERRRIARDLREHLGQQLTALQLTVEALAASVADQPRRSKEIQVSLEMIAGIGRGLDAIARELRPAALDDLGLSAVLRNYVRQWSRHCGIRGTFHSGPPDTERFPPEVEATLYRIARTALETVVPAGATSVEVLLERRDANVLLVVEADGVAAATERQDEAGLAHMRERVNALGGSLETEPTPAGGSAILARVPLLTSSYAGPVVAAGVPVSEAAVGEPTGGTDHLLRARLADLRSAVAARDEFVATVAHETLDRLLDVSRLSTGRVDRQPEPVNLVSAVREIVGSFEAELGAAQCPMRVDARSAPTGSWDRMRLEQICRNLFSNAIRFGAGSPIEVSIDGDTDFAILQVRDHGVGIAPDQQSRMFEQLERGAEQRSGGFGIGLWVVKNICAAMGGTVSVESTVGEGACFTVMLPRYTPDS